jgi:hypothetical protein
MIFLGDNVYLERDLQFDDIKPRLLGESFNLQAMGWPKISCQVIGELAQA